MGCHPSHWRTHIFQRGRSTTNQQSSSKILVFNDSAWVYTSCFNDVYGLTIMSWLLYVEISTLTDHLRSLGVSQRVILQWTCMPLTSWLHDGDPTLKSWICSFPGAKQITSTAVTWLSQTLMAPLRCLCICQISICSLWHVIYIYIILYNIYI